MYSTSKIERNYQDEASAAAAAAAQAGDARGATVPPGMSQEASDLVEIMSRKLIDLQTKVR